MASVNSTFGRVKWVTPEVGFLQAVSVKLLARKKPKQCEKEKQTMERGMYD